VDEDQLPADVGDEASQQRQEEIEEDVLHLALLKMSYESADHDQHQSRARKWR
jgi:hypothetical protein